MPVKRLIQIFLLILASVSMVSFFVFRDLKTPSPVVAEQASLPEELDDIVIHSVALLADQAEPQALTIQVGEYVQFNSQDGQYHKMGYGSGEDQGDDHAHLEGAYDSEVFGPDEANRVQFKEPGTYYFHDHLNAKIFTTVTVYAASGN